MNLIKKMNIGQCFPLRVADRVCGKHISIMHLFRNQNRFATGRRTRDNENEEAATRQERNQSKLLSRNGKHIQVLQWLAQICNMKRLLWTTGPTV